MDMATILIRTIMIYFSVFFMLRIMGKREIGKLSVFDLVISIMIAEIAVLVIEDIRKPMMEGILPMLTLVCIQLLTAYLSLKSHWLRTLIDGTPSYLIENGKINRKEMSRQRYNLSDLMLQLRQNNVTNVADVAFAVLETTGKLTVIKKTDYYSKEIERSPVKPMMPGYQMELSVEIGDNKEDNPIRRIGLPLPLIMDGQVFDKNLERIGYSRFWLKNQLAKKGLSDFKEVFLCTIDHTGRLHIDVMEP